MHYVACSHEVLPSRLVEIAIVCDPVLSTVYWVFVCVQGNKNFFGLLGFVCII